MTVPRFPAPHFYRHIRCPALSRAVPRCPAVCPALSRAFPRLILVAYLLSRAFPRPIFIGISAVPRLPASPSFIGTSAVPRFPAPHFYRHICCPALSRGLSRAVPCCNQGIHGVYQLALAVQLIYIYIYIHGKYTPTCLHALLDKRVCVCVSVCVHVRCACK